jgi:hypothetical protein
MSVILSDYDGSYDTFPEIRKIAQAIVTGNSWEDADDVFDMEVPLIPIFFNPVSSKENNQGKIILHKANIINLCKATKFFEDVPEEASQLRLLCPNTKIILVPKGGKIRNI